MSDDTTKMEKVTTSPPNTLNKQKTVKWLANTAKFFLPLLTIYLGSVSAVISLNNNEFHSWMLWPTPAITGAIALYVINTSTDLITKFTSENKFVEGTKIN